MTNDEKRQRVTETVRTFAWQYYQDLARRAGQMVPGLDGQFPHDIVPDNIFERTMEPQEWLEMALYGAGVIEGDAGYIREICQGLAEWMFALPDTAQYGIPDAWADSPMGALWWQAMIRTEGDELITLAEAAELTGVSIKTLSSRVDRGQLRAFVDPLAPERQGRRLVRKQEVLIAGDN